MSPAIQTLEIPDWLPSSDNVASRHWSRRHRAKKADRALVAGYALAARLVPATGKRRLLVAFRVRRGTTAPDPTNLLKSLLDALVHARLLVDDHFEAMELGGLSMAWGDADCTRVTLEDVFPGEGSTDN